jgi:hypothetical protein
MLGLDNFFQNDNTLTFSFFDQAELDDALKKKSENLEEIKVIMQHFLAMAKLRYQQDDATLLGVALTLISYLIKNEYTFFYHEINDLISNYQQAEEDQCTKSNSYHTPIPVQSPSSSAPTSIFINDGWAGLSAHSSFSLAETELKTPLFFPTAPKGLGGKLCVPDVFTRVLAENPNMRASVSAGHSSGANSEEEHADYELPENLLFT